MGEMYGVKEPGQSPKFETPGIKNGLMDRMMAGTGVRTNGIPPVTPDPTPVTQPVDTVEAPVPGPSDDVGPLGKRGAEKKQRPRPAPGPTPEPTPEPTEQEKAEILRREREEWEANHGRTE